MNESVAKVRLLRSIEEIERLVSSQELEEEEEKEQEEKKNKKKDEETVKKVEIEMELKKTRELLVRARNSVMGRSMSELEWLDFERKAIESTLLRFASSSSAPLSSSVPLSSSAPSLVTSSVTSNPSTVTSSTVTSSNSTPTTSKSPPPPPPPPPPTRIPTPTFDETYYSYDNFNDDDFDSNKINFKAQVEAARRKAKQQIQAARARRKARSYYTKNTSGRGEEEWRRRYRELNHHSQKNEDEITENVVRMVNEKFASETKKSPPEKKSPPSYRDAKNSLRDQKFTKNRFFLQARSYRKGKS